MYWDGEIVAKKSGDFRVSSDMFNTYMAFGDGFKGLIDEARVWQKYISESSIRQHMFDAVIARPGKIFNFDKSKYMLASMANSGFYISHSPMGNSKLSTSSKIKTHFTATPTTVPKNISLIKNLPGEIWLQWDLPIDNGGANIISYTVAVYKKSGQ